ncbi:MAG: hypothetical protein K8W52_21490 [Deltaproteobacteria bacterium]|nr:hypothetical protein [Deltaproteobacteria bacterium]
MSNVEVRGYTVLKTAEYIRQTAGEQEAKRIFNTFSPDLQYALGSATAAGWQPVAISSELFRAVAALAKGNEEKAKQELVTCGKFLASEATNTFLKLLMKVLTPSMFAKKLPSLWSRDATAGKFSVDVFDDRIVCRLSEMEAFDHIAPISVGYVSFSLEAMRKHVDRWTLHGWSLAAPNPAESTFELYWR